MIKKTINYVDYNDVERSEDFYFNLTKAELMEMELGTNGGIVQMFEKIVQEKDAVRILSEFKKIILKSYGEKSPDGKHFIKNAELRDAFEQSPAYSELFMILATDENEAKKFIEGVLPKNLGNQSSIPAPSNK